MNAKWLCIRYFGNAIDWLSLIQSLKSFEIFWFTIEIFSLSEQRFQDIFARNKRYHYNSSKKRNHKPITWHLLPYKFVKQGVGCYSNSTIESQDDVEKCKERSWHFQSPKLFHIFISISLHLLLSLQCSLEKYIFYKK